MNTIHGCGHVTFSYATPMLPFLNNVLQNRVVLLNTGCLSPSLFVRYVPPVFYSGLEMRAVGLEIALLLLLSGDVEVNPGPLGEFLDQLLQVDIGMSDVDIIQFLGSLVGEVNHSMA